jgi:hypothetical protein
LKQYKLIIFDLDGTLTDSGPGIINSVHYALEKMGISEDDRLKLHAFVGPPLIDSFQEFYGMTDKEAWQAIQYYREYFVAQGMSSQLIHPNFKGYPGTGRGFLKYHAQSLSGQIVMLLTSFLQFFDFPAYLQDISYFLRTKIIYTDKIPAPQGIIDLIHPSSLLSLFRVT